MNLSANIDERARRGGFTLLEVMIVVLLLSIVAATFIPHFKPSAEEQLYAAAHVVASDLQYCRSLAVTHDSSYQLEFDSILNRYELSHIGSDPSLDALPPSAFMTSGVGSGGKPVQYNVLTEMPGSGAVVRLHQVTRAGAPSASQVQFTPMGALATPGRTQVWLTTGTGTRQRYIAITVNAATGAVRVGSLSSYDAGG